MEGRERREGTRKEGMEWKREGERGKGKKGVRKEGRR